MNFCTQFYSFNGRVCMCIHKTTLLLNTVVTYISCLSQPFAIESVYCAKLYQYYYDCLLTAFLIYYIRNGKHNQKPSDIIMYNTLRHFGLDLVPSCIIYTDICSHDHCLCLIFPWAMQRLIIIIGLLAHYIPIRFSWSHMT